MTTSESTRMTETKTAVQPHTATFAHIVYWGAPGSGKSTNLHKIHESLRADERGVLREIPTRLDPTTSYEELEIELGDVAGVPTRLSAVAVPSAPEQAPTRKQLLDRCDGIVLVLDGRSEQCEANLASFEELRRALADYGRDLQSLPLVLQYNRRDQTDAFAVEELHRKLAVSGAAVFEATASEGRGVLQALTTISKQVIRALRDGERPRSHVQSAPAAAEPPITAPVPGAFGTDHFTADADSSITDQATDRDSELAIADWTSSAKIDAVLDSDDTQPDAMPEVYSDPGVQSSVERARAAFDVPWAEIEREFAETDEDAVRFGRIDSAEVGTLRVEAGTRVRVPLILRNSAGRSLRITLQLEIDAEEEAPS